MKNCNCLRCGEYLAGVLNRTKYCRTCARIVDNERRRAQRTARKNTTSTAESGKIAGNKRPMTIAEAAVAAKQAGMSYGAFVSAGLAYKYQG